MRFAAVHDCIRVLSEDIASLPIHVYQRDKESGKERLRTHPLYELVHDRPKPEMIVFTFNKCMMVNVLMTGNAYAFIEFNQAGQVIGLWPLLSDNVYPCRSDSGAIRYWTRHGIRSSVLFNMPMGERLVIRAFYEHERGEIERALKGQRQVFPVVDLLQMARG